MDLLGLCRNAPPSLISRSLLRSSGRDEATRRPDEWDRDGGRRERRGSLPQLATIAQKPAVCISIEDVAPWPMDLGLLRDTIRSQ